MAVSLQIAPAQKTSRHSTAACFEQVERRGKSSLALCIPNGFQGFGMLLAEGIHSLPSDGRLDNRVHGP